VSVLYLLLAVREAGKQNLGFSQFTKEKWKLWRKPLIFSCLGGLFMAMYLVTWQGALLFILIISLYMVIQVIIDHLQNQSTSYLGIPGFVFFLVAVIIFLPSVITNEIRLVIVTALLLPLFLTGLSILFKRTGFKRGYYPLALIVVAVIFFSFLYIRESYSFHVLVTRFETVFFPQGYSAATTSEMQPFLSVSNNFSTQVAWENFTTSFFLTKSWPIPGFGIISFVILVWLYIKNRGRQKLHLFLIIWTLVMFIATLIQRRFAYYLTINIALLSGYLAWQIIWLGGLRNLASRIGNKVEKPQDKTAREKRRKKRKESQGIAVYYIRIVGAAVVVFVLFFLFNITMSKQEASVTPLAPSNAWEEGLTWLKENSHEPLESSQAYFEYHTINYDYTTSVYCVASWWDYGYWISRIAHRIPIINPSQNTVRVKQIASLLISPDVNSTDITLKRLKAKYIICDTAMVTTKFWGIVTWTGKEKEDFYEDYYVIQNGQLVAATVFYPDYYESLLVRLYNFDGKAVEATEPTVITFAEKIGQDGKPFKQITGAQKFATYKEAMAYISEAGPANHRLVSMNPFASPVPLESVENYRLVFSSKETNSTIVKDVAIPQVKIFEYTGN
jgi:dolichyl-phosphooligosaccharide-protein glycotransferase